jgi:hypothetical protein
MLLLLPVLGRKILFITLSLSLSLSLFINAINLRSPQNWVTDTHTHAHIKQQTELYFGTSISIFNSLMQEQE